MRKSNKKGFTLVELVVVIAIIGVLAAILVPTMMNYVKKSRLKTANSNAKLIFTTANNQSADIVAEGGATTAVTFNGHIQSVAAGTTFASKINAAVWDALKDNGNGTGYAYYNLDSNGDVKLAQWRSDNGAKVITGQYPDPIKTVSDAESVTLGTKKN